MNPTFDFGRCGLLVRQHWIENKKRYLLSIAAMAGILFMWFFFNISADDQQPMNESLQRGTYFFLLFAGGCFYASQFYRELSSRSRAINYLLTPASSFEKLLVSLLFAVVFFFVMYTVVFYLVDAIMVTAANSFHPAYNEPNASGVTYKTSVVNIFEKFGPINVAPYIFAAFFAFQSAFLLGSVYYERYSFVKTIISLFVFFLIMYLVEVFLLQSLMPEGRYHRTIASYRVYQGPDQPMHLVELPYWIGDTLRVLVQWGFPLFFWVVSYYRLKEKEV